MFETFGVAKRINKIKDGKNIKDKVYSLEMEILITNWTLPQTNIKSNANKEEIGKFISRDYRGNCRELLKKIYELIGRRGDN